MKKKSVFISFDYDNDHFLKVALVGQSLHNDTPFSMKDGSIKEHLTGVEFPDVVPADFHHAVPLLKA